MFIFYTTDEIHNSKSQKFGICDLRHWQDGNKEYKTSYLQRALSNQNIQFLLSNLCKIT